MQDGMGCHAVYIDLTERPSRSLIFQDLIILSKAGVGVGGGCMILDMRYPFVYY